MLSELILALLLLCTTPVVHGQNDNVWLGDLAYAKQVNWEKNAIWPLASKQTVAWKTNYTSYYIELWQHDVKISGAGQTGLGRILNSTSISSDDASGQHSFDWNVTIDLNVKANLDVSPVFFLWLFESYDNGSTGGSFGSYGFNITKEVAPTISTTSTTGTPTPTPSASSESAATAAQTQSEEGTPIALKVGLGVGISLGIPLLLLLGGLIGWRVVARRKRSSASEEKAFLPASEPPQGFYFQQQPQELSATREIQELKGGSMQAHELNGVPKRAELSASH